MQFLTSLFGGSENTAITAVLALGIVLVLIVLGVWVLKVFFKASSNIGRGRNRRLSVIDSVTIDSRRQLLIVRRDQVEHLILTGGPQDLIIESGIPVDTIGRPVRRPVPGGLGRLPAQPKVEAAAPASGAAKAPPTRAHVERLRELSRAAAAPRNSPSLRHTGLMRPPGRNEPVIPINPENSEHGHIDSATTSAANDTNGQAELGAGNDIGDAVKAEGK
jgi:hypothetical protein